MTLEGTIVYADKQAEWMSKYSDVGEYESRSEYYRQLAEWLRELKKYKESDTIFEAFQTVGIMIRAKVNELCNDGKFIEAEEIEKAYKTINEYFENSLMWKEKEDDA